MVIVHSYFDITRGFWGFNYPFGGGFHWPILAVFLDWYPFWPRGNKFLMDLIGVFVGDYSALYLQMMLFVSE